MVVGVWGLRDRGGDEANNIILFAVRVICKLGKLGELCNSAHLVILHTDALLADKVAMIGVTHKLYNTLASTYNRFPMQREAGSIVS